MFDFVRTLLLATDLFNPLIAREPISVSSAFLRGVNEQL